jgi:hypothetical protein
MEQGMGRVKIPYYWVKNGYGYWTPRRDMIAKGFTNVPCGKDGPKAWTIAKQWNDRWQHVKVGKVDAVEVWPCGSLGDAFLRFKRTSEWTRKEPRTREDWERGWKHIKDVFGDRDPKSLTLEDLSLWYSGAPDDPDVKGILQRLGVREAHRVVKVWRALWQVSAANHYCNKDDDPSFGIRRVTPRGRNQRWSEGEATRLAKQAWKDGYHGLACIIAIVWDTQFQPVDVRTLTGRHLKKADGRLVFDRLDEGREKTEKPVIGTVSRRTERLVKAYLAMRFGEVDVSPKTLLFYNRRGAPYSKDTLGDDFRVVRATLFGPDEKRQLLDFRRSGAVEALAGEVDPGHLAKKMGNTIDDNKALQDTYLPAQVAIVRMADKARLIGRRRLREGGEG